MQSIFVSRAGPSLRRAVYNQARYLATKPPSGSTAESPNSPVSDKLSDKLDADVTPPSPASLSLDFAPNAEQEEEPAQRTGARSSKDSLSSIERRRKAMGRATLATFAVGLLAGTAYLGREWTEEDLKNKKMKIEDAPSTRLDRTKKRFTSMFDYFSKPTWEELLPPAVPPFQKPYTLLLSIDDLLVTSTWDRQNGWRTAKRPGVDYFIAYLSQFYEVVIFTSQNYYTALPIIEKLDPYNFFITYKLFREATRSVNGSVVKDLSYLNRDLSKVIILDTNPKHVSLQPENAIVLPKWKGERGDKGLVSLIPFLESIAIYGAKDVRPVLKAYEGKNIPIEYGKQEAEAKRRFIEEWRRSGKSKSGGLTISGLFGGSQGNDNSPEPLTYLELKRKEAQARYREEQTYIATNRQEFDRLLEEDRKAAAAQMSGNLFSIMSGIGGAPPPLPNREGQTPSPGQVATQTSKSE